MRLSCVIFFRTTHGLMWPSLKPVQVVVIKKENQEERTALRIKIKLKSKESNLQLMTRGKRSSSGRFPCCFLMITYFGIELNCKQNISLQQCRLLRPKSNINLAWLPVAQALLFICCLVDILYELRNPIGAFFGLVDLRSSSYCNTTLPKDYGSWFSCLHTL